MLHLKPVVECEYVHLLKHCRLLHSEVLVIYICILNTGYFIMALHYISEGNMLLLLLYIYLTATVSLILHANYMLTLYFPGLP